MSLSPISVILALLVSVALLGGCGKNDDQAALEAAVQQLQDNLAGKRISETLKQLHPQFYAQQTHDREWARRTMALLFMRHQNVMVLALHKTSYIDPIFREKGHTEALITLTGGEGLIPDSARQYRVKLEWWLEDGEWKLARMGWE